MRANGALSNNRVLMPHLVIAHAMLAQHLGRKNQLFDKAANGMNRNRQAPASVSTLTDRTGSSRGHER